MDKTNIASKPTISRKRASQINYGKILTYLILSLGAIVAIVPFLWMLSASLMNLTEATGRAVLPRIAQWSNYQEAWTGANFKGFFANAFRTVCSNPFGNSDRNFIMGSGSLCKIEYIIGCTFSPLKGTFPVIKWNRVAPDE